MLLPKIKNLSLLHPKNAAFFNLVHLSSASAAVKTLNPFPKSNPIAEFLINSCGFSAQKAASPSKSISRCTSADQAHSVRHFFKHDGFADVHVRRIVSNMPRILHADADKTLKPNLQTLRGMGFTESEVQLLVVSNPPLLVNPLAIPRLEFWRNFLGISSKKGLVKVFTRNANLIAHGTLAGIAPKIALLKEHGLSETDIAHIVRRGHRFITRSIKSIKALLNTVEELGFDPKSPMFGHALSSLSGIGRVGLEERREFFKGLGWSEEEFLAALKKAPSVVRLSKENVLEKMDFFVGRVGYEQSYIASNPLLLMFSLEKRLKPRYYVMEVLKSNEIVQKRGIYTIMSLSEKDFVESVILRYKDQLPKIHEIYLAACSGHMPI